MFGRNSSHRRSLLDRIFSFIESKGISDRLIVYSLAFIVCISGVMLLISFNEGYLSDVPTDGGTLYEGIVGSPRFVNPVLAITRADQDMTALVYAGLMRISEDGSLEPDIAQSVTVSDDARTYDVVLRDDVVFHDGTPLTADDVIFTINLTQDPTLKSPKQGNFDGVTVEKISDHELTFTLEEPYAPFIENLTLGIIPKHEWASLTPDQIPFSQHNTEPIGAGPYVIKNVGRNQSGLINSYTLVPHTESYRRPKIETIVVSFFPNESALADAINTGKVTSATGLSDTTISTLTRDADLVESTTALPRTFGVFFNQNKSAVLRQSEVREALALMIDQSELVATVLDNDGIPINSPLPAGFTIETASSTFTSYREPSTTPDERFKQATELLEARGWEKNDAGIWTKTIDGAETELSVDIATANLDFLADTALYIKTQWEKLGARVSVRQFEQSDLTQAVIRTRDYEALLFGTAVGRALDYYPFWHSSQRNDPGLNIALYANITADAALETARTSTSTETRNQALDTFLTEIESDQPAIFLFTPVTHTISPAELTAPPLMHLSTPSERFSNVETWHITTQSVWPFFTQHNNN